MDRDQIEQVVVKTLSAALKCEVDRNTSRQNTPQWDSLKHIDAVFTLEEELNLEFSEQEMVEMDSVAKIVELVLHRNAA